MLPVLGLTVAAGLALAGCGSSGGAEGPSGPPNGAAPLLGGVSDDQFCAAVLQAAEVTRQRMQQMREQAKNGGTIDGPAESRRVADNWAALAAIAPSEVKPDLQTIADKTMAIANGNRDRRLSQDMVQPTTNYRKWVQQHCPGAASLAPHPGG